jgi:hypothetical protein
MPTQVTISSDTSTLEIQAAPVVSTDPAMEFSSGSFKGTVDERRVAFVDMVIPTGTKLFSLRFEFTDHLLATTDIWGTPVYLNDEDRIQPYQEAGASKEQNPDVNK